MYLYSVEWILYYQLRMKLLVVMKSEDNVHRQEMVTDIDLDSVTSQMMGDEVQESFRYLAQNLLDSHEKTLNCQQVIEKRFICSSTDQVEQSLRQLLQLAFKIPESHTRRKYLFSLFQHFMEKKLCPSEWCTSVY